MTLIIRGTTYYLRKRVPIRYRPVEDRSEILHSLHTDSLSVAGVKSKVIWTQLVESWEARLAGDTQDAEARYAAARNMAKIQGHRYLKGAQVAQLPLEQILQRVEAVPIARGKPSLVAADAFLGASGPPAITVSRALELFWTLADDRIAGKNTNQVRLWRNPRIKAVKNFVEVIGNIPIEDITAEHMLDFREWWWEKIKEEDLSPNTGNKDLVHLGDVLRTVNKMKRLGLTLPLEGFALKQGDKNTRPPFSTKWISEKLLKPGALLGLNGEARGILLGMINTGYRPSEGAELRSNHIHLGGEVPYISIEAEDRTLKSQASKRQIPLAGVSLEAFKEFPDGFPRYRDSAALSSTVNSFLRENGLFESDEHTMYSLRHSFEDRMLAAGVDERIRRDLFGHSLNRERYGAGASLEHKLRVIRSVAL